VVALVAAEAAGTDPAADQHRHDHVDDDQHPAGLPAVVAAGPHRGAAVAARTRAGQRARPAVGARALPPAVARAPAPAAAAVADRGPAHDDDSTTAADDDAEPDSELVVHTSVDDDRTAVVVHHVAPDHVEHPHVRFLTCSALVPALIGGPIGAGTSGRK
jgi:hypothetical protein